MSNPGLIDWRLVSFSALWIAGLSLILAACSFADYSAAERHLRTRTVLRQPGYQAAINAGLVLFCLGLMGSSRTWWEQVLWGALAIAFAYLALTARRRAGPKA